MVNYIYLATTDSVAYYILWESFALKHMHMHIHRENFCSTKEPFNTGGNLERRMFFSNEKKLFMSDKVCFVYLTCQSHCVDSKAEIVSRI